MTKRRFSRKRAGFTLMEILLVLVILVVLAGAVVMNFGTLQDRSLTKTAKVTINNLAQSIQQYRFDLNTYPPSLDALLAPPPELANPKKWQGPYVDKGRIPLDPWDNAFQYSFPGQHNPQGFDLASMGVDGQANTDDDVGNWD